LISIAFACCVKNVGLDGSPDFAGVGWNAIVRLTTRFRRRSAVSNSASASAYRPV
jgi:hypothetical protein